MFELALIYAIWMGNNGYPGIGNIVKMVYWVIVMVIAPLALLGVTLVEIAILAERKSSKPRRFMAVFADILALGLFAYYGQFVMAGVATVGMVQMVVVWGIIDYRIDKAKGTK